MIKETDLMRFEPDLSGIGSPIAPETSNGAIKNRQSLTQLLRLRYENLCVWFQRATYLYTQLRLQKKTLEGAGGKRNCMAGIPLVLSTDKRDPFSQEDNPVNLSYYFVINEILLPLAIAYHTNTVEAPPPVPKPANPDDVDTPQPLGKGVPNPQSKTNGAPAAMLELQLRSPQEVAAIERIKENALDLSVDGLPEDCPTMTKASYHFAQPETLEMVTNILDYLQEQGLQEGSAVCLDEDGCDDGTRLGLFGYFLAIFLVRNHIPAHLETHLRTMWWYSKFNKIVALSEEDSAGSYLPLGIA